MCFLCTNLNGTKNEILFRALQKRNIEVNLHKLRPIRKKDNLRLVGERIEIPTYSRSNFIEQTFAVGIFVENNKRNKSGLTMNMYYKLVLRFINKPEKSHKNTNECSQLS